IVRPRPVKISLKNRHVLITGGSSGIGLAMAHHAAKEGARVSILARSLGRLEEARNSIQLSTGVKVTVFEADVRDFDVVKSAISAAEPIDVLVVNQDVFLAEELEKQSLDEIRFMIDVNLIGSFNVGIYSYTAYSASKFRLRGLAEAMQQEVIVDDIHIYLVFPPDTDTPVLEEENKRRLHLTTIIAASSRAMKAPEVAKKAFDGISLDLRTCWLSSWNDKITGRFTASTWETSNIDAGTSIPDNTKWNITPKDDCAAF
ncbi:3-dehydrosphinganine reductase TSC10B, partial [Linum perenne]